MKKIRNILVVVIGVLALTGCGMKFETDMAITKAGKMDYSIIAAYDKELITTMMSMDDMSGAEGGTTEGGTTGTEKPAPTDAELIDFFYKNMEEESESNAEAQKLGFTQSRWQEGDFIGYKLTATIDDIKTVSSDTDVTFDMSAVMNGETPIASQKLFKKADNVYTATFVFDPANQNPNSGDLGTGGEGGTAGGEGSLDPETQQQIEQAVAQMVLDYKFVLTLPVAPITHNATNVSEDGKTLTWTLSSKEKTDVNFSFELAPAKAASTGFKLDETMLMYIGIGAIALIVIIVIVIMISKNKKKKNNEVAPEVVNETTPVSDALNATPANPVVNNTTPVAPVESTPVEPIAQESAPAPVESTPTEVAPTTPVETSPVIEVPVTPVVETPVAETPAVEVTPVAPTPEVTPVAPVPEVPAAPTTPANENVVSPVIDTVVVGDQTNNTNVQ